LLTDPLLRNRVWHLQRQGEKIDPQVYQDISAVLVTHAHSDHLDPPSLKRLDHETLMIVPRGTAGMVRNMGFRNIKELSANEKMVIGSVSVGATHAEHNGSRFRYGRRTETLGYLIDGSARIFFVGDTELFPGMADLATELDIALIPVWGWGPYLGPGHMDPYQAAQALQLLQPKVAVPIHWGTFFPYGFRWVIPRILSNPPRAFSNYAERLAPQVKVHILSPGKKLRLDWGGHITPHNL
jgi:L-ascorbate metabolism protein UlaG (beta-lactamase superfamily)